MQEEFEKKVQERVHTFGLQPSPQVWDDINAVLGKRKHRRIFIGWWILLGLVIAGGGILFYEKDNIIRNELNQHPIPATDTLQQNNMVQSAPAAPDENQKATQQESKQNPSPTKPSITPAQQTTTQAQQTAAGSNGQSYINSQPFNSKKTTNITVHGGDIASTQQATNAGNNPAITGNVKNNEPAKQDVSMEPSVPNSAVAAGSPTGTPPVAAETDKETAQKQPPGTAPPGDTPPNNTPSATGEKINIKTIATARHQWFFTFGGGTTQTIAHSSFHSIENNFATGTTQNVLALTSPAAYKYNINKPGTGYHISLGLAYQYKLSPHVLLSVGAQAAYLSNTQKTGSFVKNSFYIADSRQDFNNVTVNTGTLQTSYYLAAAAGSDYTVVNKAWQLQLPVNINYVVNPHAKTKLLLNAGASYAWMFGSNWLIPDSRYEKLYYNKSLLSNHIVSWQAGPALQLRNDIKLGLQYQQSFTTFAKGYITPKMYWQNISLDAAIPINIKFKKGKK